MGAKETTDGLGGFEQLEIFRQRPDRLVRCFMSHSYEDGTALAKMRAALPAHVEQVIFPQLPEARSDALSKALLETIGNCDVLVYLRGGRSETSLWTNFERRYARRRNIEVYSFDPNTGEVRKFIDEPHNIVIPLMIRYQGEDDDARVYKVLQWLLLNRNVASTVVSLPREREGTFDHARWMEANSSIRRVGLEFHAGSGRDKGIDRELWNFYRAVQLGGTVMLFLTNAACEVAWPHADLYLDVLTRDGGDPTFDRPKIVWMEPPDRRRIDAAFECLGDRPDNLNFRVAVRKSIESLVLGNGKASSRPLDSGTPLWRTLALERNGEIDWKKVDTLLIDLEFAAQRRNTRAPDTRFEHHEQAAKREAQNAIERMRKGVTRRTISAEDF